MPKLIATPDILEEIARHVLLGKVRKLKIARYKTGAKTGQLYAEYSLKENTTSIEPNSSVARTSASSFLNKAAHHMREGKLRDIVMHKRDANIEEYTHRMELGGAK